MYEYVYVLLVPGSHSNLSVGRQPGCSHSLEFMQQLERINTEAYGRYLLAHTESGEKGEPLASEVFGFWFDASSFVNYLTSQTKASQTSNGCPSETQFSQGCSSGAYLMGQLWRSNETIHVMQSTQCQMKNKSKKNHTKYYGNYMYCFLSNESLEEHMSQQWEKGLTQQDQGVGEYFISEHLTF